MLGAKDAKRKLTDVESNYFNRAYDEAYLREVTVIFASGMVHYWITEENLIQTTGRYDGDVVLGFEGNWRIPVLARL